MKKSLFRIVPVCVCCGILLPTSLNSCSSTGKTVGCTIGGLTAGAAAAALVNAYDKRRKKSGKDRLSNAEKTAIIAAASGIGCLIGSKIGGEIEKYVEKKREDYRTEAEYLQAHIDDLNKNADKLDDEIARLQNESGKLDKELANLEKLPALREPLSKQLKEAAVARQKAAEGVTEYLAAAKADAKKAYDSSSDVQRKAELGKLIGEYDNRLAQAQKINSSITRIAY